MNLLERLSSLSIFLLVCFIIIVSYNHLDSSNSKKLKSVKNTAELNIGNKNNADETFKKSKKHIEEARRHSNKNDFINAVEQYYKASKLNPEYMDASSKYFLGEELKRTIKLSIVKLNQKLKENPDSKEIMMKLKKVYKMERNFGHGCE